MDKTERLFVASSDIFSDFEVSISLYNISTIDDIIKIFKNELIRVLQDNKLSILIQRLENINFHIHNFSIEEILTSEEGEIFYIWDHK